MVAEFIGACSRASCYIVIATCGKIFAADNTDSFNLRLRAVGIFISTFGRAKAIIARGECLIFLAANFADKSSEWLCNLFAFRNVNLSVLVSCQQLKIFNVVVGRIPVNVVNVITFWRLTEIPSPNVTMKVATFFKMPVWCSVVNFAEKRLMFVVDGGYARQFANSFFYFGNGKKFGTILTFGFQRGE